MEKRQKTGGRKKGTPNKQTKGAELLELCREALGDEDWHPVVAMAKVAASQDKKISEELKFQANKEAAQYIAPKLKAVEHSLSDETAAAVFNMNFLG